MTCTVNGGWCGAAVLSICIPKGCLPIRHGGKVAFFNIISLTDTTTLVRVSHSPVLPVSVIRSSFFFAFKVLDELASSTPAWSITCTYLRSIITHQVPYITNTRPRSSTAC